MSGQFIFLKRIIPCCKIVGSRILIVDTFFQIGRSFLLPGGFDHLISGILESGLELHGVVAHGTLRLPNERYVQFCFIGHGSWRKPKDLVILRINISKLSFC
jgi:hypothetical protein